MTAVRHRLKVWPRCWQAIADGSKTFELRKNDRGFQPGDVVDLYKFDPELHDADCGVRCPLGVHGVEQPYRVLRFRIGFVMSSAFGCDLGEYVVFSLLPETS